jgi:hypothetical protein
VIAQQAPAHARLNQPATPAAAARSSANAAEKISGKPNREGIGVHGHWVIDVRNSDGKLVTHREFENSLTKSGADLLVGLLNGNFTPGDWMILLGPNNNVSPCGGGSNYCAIVKSLTTFLGSSNCTQSQYVCAPTLTSTAYFGPIFGDAASFTLAGSFTATSTGALEMVQTSVGACANVASSGAGPTTSATISPNSCVTSTTNNWSLALTSTTVAPAVAVAAGQLVQVTVTITFS